MYYWKRWKQDSQTPAATPVPPVHLLLSFISAALTYSDQMAVFAPQVQVQNNCHEKKLDTGAYHVILNNLDEIFGIEILKIKKLQNNLLVWILYFQIMYLLGHNRTNISPNLKKSYNRKKLDLSTSYKWIIVMSHALSLFCMSHIPNYVIVFPNTHTYRASVLPESSLM